MGKNYNQIKKIILSGLLIFIIGTNDVISALIFSGTLIFTSLIIRIFSLTAQKKFKVLSEDYFLWGIGLSLVSFLYLVLPHIFPKIAGYINNYYLLIGVTPLVFLNSGKNNRTDFIKNSILFLLLMIFISSLREMLGYGNLLGYNIINNPLLEISRRPAGALIILGISGLALEFLYHRFNISRKIANKFLKNENEREVTP
jgi:glucan phosphoethanolaminetransferase (alkaline phosphatase superfamily)